MCGEQKNRKKGGVDRKIRKSVCVEKKKGRGEKSKKNATRKNKKWMRKNEKGVWA